MSAEISPLQRARAAYQPKLPAVFRAHGANVRVTPGAPVPGTKDQAAIHALFPLTSKVPVVHFTAGPAAAAAAPINVGVILSGGQAPGGHNVIAGLFDALKSLHPASRLVGFRGGPGGLLKNRAVELTADIIDQYRNTGGFDIIASDRTKLEKTEDFDKVFANLLGHGLNALVVIGGDDSNTNAAILAEYARKTGKPVQVIGCPKTIDGDLKNEYIETSFGFDTACRVFSELIGNIARDALSATKYWHFIKVMGRSASHIALECALQTHANITLISEEIAAKKQTLAQIVDYIAGVVAQRAANKMNYGLVIIPEGLIEFIPEMKVLISELNELLGHGHVTPAQIGAAGSPEALVKLGLTAPSAAAFLALPPAIGQQLLADRDPHGNVQVAKIETERLLILAVEQRLAQMAAAGTYTGKFSAQGHYLGYEGRCAVPTNFDADYCYGLGYSAAALIATGQTGYLSCVRDLLKTPDQWQAGGVPLTTMMVLERRHGKDKPVIEKALVTLTGKPFTEFAKHRDHWALNNDYLFPGPIQYFGPAAVCDLPPKTLVLERT